MSDVLTPVPPTNTPIDQDVTDFNALSGNFDLVRNFNPDRILTESLNAAGNPLVNYDPVTETYQQADDEIITDDLGNVVTT